MEKLRMLHLFEDSKNFHLHMIEYRQTCVCPDSQYICFFSKCYYKISVITAPINVKMYYSLVITSKGLGKKKQNNHYIFFKSKY